MISTMGAIARRQGSNLLPFFLMLMMLAAPARAQMYIEFPLPSGAVPHGITAGPDGNLWFAEFYGNKIGRLTPAGSLTEFPLPTAFSFPEDITAGPDGALWFTESSSSGRIGRITTGGAFTEFTVPTPSGEPYGITVGPDGNLWFTEYHGKKIGRITPSGTITEFPLPAASGNPPRITTGPDGNLWFTERDQGTPHIGRITPSGTITEFSMPYSPSGPFDVTTGADGNLWYTDGSCGIYDGCIARITPAGIVTVMNQNVAGSSGSTLKELTASPGGVWFAAGRVMGSITPSGTLDNLGGVGLGLQTYGVTIWTRRKFVGHR